MVEGEAKAWLGEAAKNERKIIRDNSRFAIPYLWKRFWKKERILDMSEGEVIGVVEGVGVGEGGVTMEGTMGGSSGLGVERESLRKGLMDLSIFLLPR
jgi:hypothetical protein